jgi:hypothetical protein
MMTHAGLSSRRILRPHLVEVLLRIRRHAPGVGPKAEVDGPPIGGDRFHDFREKLIEIQLPRAKGVMRAGLVLIQRAVGINEVDVVDASFQLLQEFERASFEDFLLTRMPRADCCDQVGVAGVVEHAEVVVPLGPDGIHQLDNFRWLVEREAGLELPGDVEAVIGGHFAGGVPGGDDAVHAELGIDLLFLEDVRGLHGVHADRLDAEVRGEGAVAEERGQVRTGIVGVDELGPPEVRCNAGEGQAVIRNFLLELLARCLGRMRFRRRVLAEGAELDAVHLEVLQLVQDRVPGDFLRLVEHVRPTADGEFLHGYCSPG